MRRFDLLDEYSTVYVPFRPLARPLPELDYLTRPTVRTHTLRRWLSWFGFRDCRTTRNQLVSEVR